MQTSPVGAADLAIIGRQLMRLVRERAAIQGNHLHPREVRGLVALAVHPDADQAPTWRKELALIRQSMDYIRTRWI